MKMYRASDKTAILSDFLSNQNESIRQQLQINHKNNVKKINPLTPWKKIGMTRESEATSSTNLPTITSVQCIIYQHYKHKHIFIKSRINTSH